MLRGDLMTASVRPILASAAIPTFFRSVRLDGGTYWDGLFSQNPPIKELTDEKPDEIWVIQINPSELEDEPRRGRDNWLRDIQSVTPLEEIPRWVISNYFYREMSPWLRYSVVPFLILFTASIVNLVGLALEASGIIATRIFLDDRLLAPFGIAGSILGVIFTVIIVILLLVSISLLIFYRDVKKTPPVLPPELLQDRRGRRKDHYRLREDPQSCPPRTLPATAPGLP